MLTHVNIRRPVAAYVLIGAFVGIAAVIPMSVPRRTDAATNLRVFTCVDMATTSSFSDRGWPDEGYRGLGFADACCSFNMYSGYIVSAPPIAASIGMPLAVPNSLTNGF